MSNVNSASTASLPHTPAPQLTAGIAVGLVAAGIGALYTVFARWGISHGLHATDLTALRFGVAGVLTLPVIAFALLRQRPALLAQWRLWGTICLLAGAPFGLLMFGGLQFAPASHAAVFPFAAMSVMGSVLSAWFLGDALTPRKLFGIGIVLLGLLVLSGIDANQLNGSTLFGDALFVAAGAMWAGFGVLLRKHRLSPVTATALISASALVLYVPMYLIMIGPSRLLAASPVVFWTEVLVQGVIAGAGTLYTYSKMVALLGADRAAVFPALAPGIAAVVAWPVLGHIPGTAEIAGLTLAMVGIIITVTRARRSAV